jgi:hypothetical protein
MSSVLLHYGRTKEQTVKFMIGTSIVFSVALLVWAFVDLFVTEGYFIILNFVVAVMNLWAAYKLQLVWRFKSWNQHPWFMGQQNGPQFENIEEPSKATPTV